MRGQGGTPKRAGAAVSGRLPRIVEGWRAGAGALGVGVLCLATAGPIRAEQHVVMPFQCAVVGDRIEVIPAAETRHQILGPREQQHFSACTSSEARNCRTIVLHRFELYCGAERVAWIRVVAAAASGRLPLRAWLEDQSLVLRQGPLRPAPGNIACASRPPGVPGNRRRFEQGFGPRDCGRPPAPGAADSITLPPGFAPVLFLRARFVHDEAAPAPPPAAVAAKSQPPPAEAARPAAPKKSPEPKQRLSAAAPAAREAAPDFATAPASAPLATPVPASASSTGNDTRTSTAQAPGAASTSGPRVEEWVTTTSAQRNGWLARLLAPLGGGTGLSLLAIGALILSATAAVARQRSAGRRATAQSAIQPEIMPDVPPLAAEPPMPPPVIPPPEPPAPDIAVARDLKATAEALCDIVHQIIEELIPDGPLREVLRTDLAGIDQRLTSPELASALDEHKLDAARVLFEAIVADLQRVRTLARIEHERATSLPAAVDAVPASREAALAFLGVNAGASNTAQTRRIRRSICRS